MNEQRPLLLRFQRGGRRGEKVNEKEENEVKQNLKKE